LTLPAAFRAPCRGRKERKEKDDEKKKKKESFFFVVRGVWCVVCDVWIVVCGVSCGHTIQLGFSGGVPYNLAQLFQIRLRQIVALAHNFNPRFRIAHGAVLLQIDSKFARRFFEALRAFAELFLWTGCFDFDSIAISRNRIAIAGNRIPNFLAHTESPPTLICCSCPQGSFSPFCFSLVCCRFSVLWCWLSESPQTDCL